jgi:tRNA U34 5-methylaminomethyl-2-thiouridine-forming methyltransferase MnmC
MQRIVKTTADGSSTVFIENTDVSYHSRHGAMQESMHVFIKNGLLALDKSLSQINILEMGFGTGLNMLLTIDAAANNPQTEYTYHAIEKYPLEEEITKKLNFPFDPLLCAKIHETAEGKLENISWHIFKGVDLSLFESAQKYHLVYFDAFAPSFQPELWTADIFNKMFSLMHKGALLVTYCAQGQVKRNMKAAGFIVESPSGPPGKREMTRAIKPSTD